MKKASILLLITLIAIITSNLNSQNISGIINSYASVSAISGNAVTVGSSSGFAVGNKVMIIQMQGATITTSSNNNFGNISNYNSAGKYEFNKILAISGNNITLQSAISNTYNNNGSIQLISVPVYCNATVTSSLTCKAWDGSTGGVLVFDAIELSLNANIDVSGKGFRGGNFVSNSFSCDQGDYFGSFSGDDGGKKGESISKYLSNMDANKGKQANGGGGANSGNSGGGGGSNIGSGGLGGNQWSGCGGTFDDRAIGGVALAYPNTTLAFMGGGGGGGYEDNGETATAGGNGGGIVYINANKINGNNRFVYAKGNSVTITANDEASGGGGGGGTVYIASPLITSSFTVNTTAGDGGSSNNSLYPLDCHGPGGGGGGGVLAYTGASIPSSITYISNGGNAGKVLNPASSCYNTTSGAANGQAGSSLNFLQHIPVIADNISIFGNDTTLCSTTSIILNASNAGATYLWNTGATSQTITANSGTYWVEVTKNNCVTRDSIVVNASPVSVIAGADDSLCLGSNYTLQAIGGANHQWRSIPSGFNASGASVSISPTINTTYIVNVNNGTCTNEDTVNIQIITACGIEIPNVITPNGDGVNDVFIVKNLSRYPNSSLTIFDRWGKRVYESSNYLNNWKAEGTSDGTFFYVLTLSDNSKKYNGFITVYHSK